MLNKVPEGHHPRGTTLREALRGNLPLRGLCRGLSEGSAGCLRGFCGVSAGFCGGPRDFPRFSGVVTLCLWPLVTVGGNLVLCNHSRRPSKKHFDTLWLSAPNHKSQIASDLKSRSPNRKNFSQIAVSGSSNRTFKSRDLWFEPLFKSPLESQCQFLVQRVRTMSFSEKAPPSQIASDLQCDSRFESQIAIAIKARDLEHLALWRYLTFFHWAHCEPCKP